MACVERLAACDWREARLLRLETETLFTGRGDTGEPDPRLGWSRTLPRYAAAIRRDRKEALDQLAMLRASRPRLTSRPAAVDAARFRWLAIAAERQAAEQEAAAANDVTPEPGQAARARSSAPATPAPPRSHPADRGCHARTRAGRPQPNRAQRRRLAALSRRAA